MDFKEILHRDNIQITAVKTLEEDTENLGGNGLIFYVENGKGALGHKYGNYENKGLLTLQYDNIPLIKFHSDEYFCPTCEKLVSAGYGLNMAEDNTINEMRQLFNLPFISIEHSFENMKPLLGLLKTGYYALVDMELYPSDGNGHFFGRLVIHHY